MKPHSYAVKPHSCQNQVPCVSTVTCPYRPDFWFLILSTSSAGQEEWTNKRTKAPSARTTKGVYREQPYSRYWTVPPQPPPPPHNLQRQRHGSPSPSSNGFSMNYPPLLFRIKEKKKKENKNKTTQCKWKTNPSKLEMREESQPLIVNWDWERIWRRMTILPLLIPEKD